MKTVELKIYEIDELDEEARQKAIKEHRTINVEGVDWFNPELRHFIREAEELGFDLELDDITFDIRRHAHLGIRKKGLSVDSDIIDGYTVMVSFPEEGPEKLGCWISNSPTRSWRKTSLSVVELEEALKDGKVIKLDSEEFEQVEEKIIKKFSELMDKCKEYYVKLENKYYSSLTDDAVAGALKEFGCRFREDGRIFRE